MSQYPPSGVLFTNNRKRSDKSPDYTGKLELSDEVLQDLTSQMDRGVEKPVLSLIGWKKVSQKTGATFLSLLGNKFEENPNHEVSSGQSGKLDDSIPF